MGKFLKGFLVTCGVTAAGILLCAFLLLKVSPPLNVLQGLLFAVCFLACFAGGLIVGKYSSSRSLIWGALFGILYYLLLWLISYIFGKCGFAPEGNAVLTGILCLLGGAAGGKLG